MAWNKPNAANQPTVKKGGAKAPSKVKGIVAGLVTVCALGCLCLWLFSGNETRQDDASAKERGRIKEVTPAAAPTNKVEKVVEKPKKRKRPDCVKPDEKGILRYPSGARYFENTGFRTNSINPMAGKKILFKHGAEIHIASLLQLKPGDVIISGITYGKAFDENFIKSLEEEVEFKDDDTEEERQLKLDVIQVKKEFKEAMDRGEKPSDIMQAAREDLVKAFQYKLNLQQQLMAIRNDPKMSEQDILDGYEAANKMLEDKGLPGFSTGVMKRRIERLKQKELEQRKKGTSK